MLIFEPMADDLGKFLREAREAKGLTQGQVGARVGITYSAVGQYESGSIKRPKLEKLSAIIDFLELDRAEANRLVRARYGFDLILNEQDRPELKGGTRPRRPRPPLEVELAPDAPAFDRIGGARDVPEHGIAVGGEDGDFTLNGEVVGYVTRPVSLRGRNVFAVRVKGSSMHPRFDEGDVLYVEQNREPAIGDDGIFEMKPNDEWEAGHAFVKRLIGKGMGIVQVRQFTPAKDFSYRRDEVNRMFRVVPRNELLAV